MRWADIRWPFYFHSLRIVLGDAGDDAADADADGSLQPMPLRGFVCLKMPPLVYCARTRDVYGGGDGYISA